MALAVLCKEVVKDDSPRMSPLYSIPDYPRTLASFSAFIVDHKIRKNSGVEAHQVADEVARLGVEPHVLELDWKARGDPTNWTNVETAARTLRYQAMGRACRDRGINTLLFAHHADDQHETVVSRIYSKYLGIGLRGMYLMASIPECAGIYGVDHSGRLEDEQERREATIDKTGSMLIESGGVTIGRPLLPLGKDELVKICQENGVKWFEDHTNVDATLTIRNTFRHLIKSQELPLALSKHRIAQMSARISEEHDEVEAAASAIFDEMPLTLDLRSGAASFTVKRALRTQPLTNYKLYSMLLRKMLEVVSCKSTISLQNIDATVNFVFGLEKIEHTPKTVQIAGVEINEDVSEGINDANDRIFILRRALPTKQERLDLQLWRLPQSTLASEWSEWILWDGRYWIRVRAPEHARDRDCGIIIKFLSAQDLETLRSTLSARRKQNLNDRLRIAKGSARFTLPAIVARERCGDLGSEVADRVVALPTLDWNADGWKQQHPGDQDPDIWLWEIRYKYVNLDLKGVPQTRIIV
jgi:tRNA(Ile)-lysidine synthase TilS/MesJ